MQKKVEKEWSRQQELEYRDSRKGEDVAGRR